MDENPLGLT